MSEFVPRTKQGIRLLFHCNAPWAKTGYGIQSNSLLPRLAKFPEIDEIGLLAYYGIAGGVSEQEIGLEMPVDHIKVKCYPARSDPWGNDVIGDHASFFDADIVITLFDLWPLSADFGWQGARWCLPADQRILTDRGYIAIVDIVEGRLPVRVLAEQEGRPIWATIEAYQEIPIEVTGKVLCVELESGKKLEITSDNLVMTRNGWVAAGELQPNMEVRVVKESERTPETSTPSGWMHLREMSRRDIRKEYFQTDSSGFSLHCRVPGCRWVYFDDLQEIGQDEDWDINFILQQESGCSGLAISEDSRSKSDRSLFSPRRGWSRGGGDLIGKGSVAILDREEETSTSSYQISRIKANEQSGIIQCPLHGRAASDVSGDARAEFTFERCRSITVCKRQPSKVYDIKTSAGCFVAEGQLIHNCPWFPIDHEPIPAQVLERTQVTYENLVYSKSAAQELDAKGVKYTYIPHGVETTLYRPLDDAGRAKAKETLGYPPNCFLVGTVGANKGYPPRKGWNEMYTAMAEFLKNSPDPDNVFFYQHSLLTGEHGGPDLQQMAQDFGLADKIRFANPYILQSMGMTTEEMNGVYNAMDAFILLSRGEGFGLPILESQSCGTPVVVTDWTACRELGEVGYKIPITHREWTPQRSFWGIADPYKAAEALLDIQNKWLAESKGWGHAYSDLRKAAREFALPYDWQTLVDNNWKPLFERLWSEIKPRIWGPMNKVWEDPEFGAPIKEEGEIGLRTDNGSKNGVAEELASATV